MKGLVSLLLLAAMPAFAQAPSGTNMTAPYPGPNCKAPAPVGSPPEPPSQRANRGTVAAYNREVEAYNAALDEKSAQDAIYSRCLMLYVNNANADLARIRDSVNAVVRASQQ